MDVEDDLIEANKIEPPKNISLDRYKHNVQIYTMDTPGAGVSFEDFRKLGLFRLSVHRIARDINDSDPQRRCKRFVELLRDIGLDSFARLFDSNCVDDDDDEELRQARWRDHVSHISARLGLSLKPEALPSLEAAEYKLFRFRLTIMSNASIESFMRINDFQFPTVDEDEKVVLKDELRTIEGASEDVNQIFYKVPYRYALEGMKGRRTFLKDGTAYLTLRLMRCPIYARFRFQWRRQVESYKLYHRTGDPKLSELREAIEQAYDWMEICGSPEATNIDDLDELAQTSYPPCMRRIHDALRTDHHLKNMGRIQYSIFLKKIGVDVTAAQDFFRDEFTKEKMDEQTFEKEYAYYIRHLYGVEGSRKTYALHNCSHLASRPIGNADYHSCAFAVADIENLDQMLVRWKLPVEKLDKNHENVENDIAKNLEDVDDYIDENRVDVDDNIAKNLEDAENNIAKNLEDVDDYIDENRVDVDDYIDENLEDLDYIDG